VSPSSHRSFGGILLDLQELAALSGFSDCNFFLEESSPINILQASGMCGHDLLCED